MIPALLAFTLLFLAGLHLYWAAGGSWGKRFAIPEVNGRPVFTPSPLITLAVGIALVCTACVAILRGYPFFASLPGSPVHWAAIALGFIFFLRAVGDFRLAGFFKRVHGTPFATWDTRLFSPLCLLISFAFFFIAAS